MSYDTVTSHLDTAKDALTAADTDRLDDAMAALTESYDQIKMAERARIARLQAARTEADLSAEQQQAITSYERSFMASYFGRGGFIGSVELFLLDPDEADAGELASQAGTLVDREQQLERTTSEAEPVLDSATVPARLGTLRFAADPREPIFGSQTTAELVLQNVGDEPAEDVQVTVEAATLNGAATAAVGGLAAGSRETLPFEIPATTGGRVELTATVDSSNAGSVTETTTITVRTKAAIVSNAMDALERLRGRITTTVDATGLERSLTSKLDAAIESLDRADAEIEAGRRKQADTAISTAMNQLGALLNALDGGSENGKKGSKGNGGSDSGPQTLADTFERAIVNRTKLAIDQLADARTTELVA